MKVRLIIYSLVAALLAITIGVTYETVLADKDDGKLPFIVRLVGPTGRTFCSGTVVSDHMIITAAHCVTMDLGPFGQVMMSEPIGIRVDADEEIGVQALAYWSNPSTDLAILKGDFQQFKHAYFATSIAEIERLQKLDNEFESCGFPLGGHLYCSRFLYKDRNLFAWSGTSIVLPGMSGGPLLLGNKVIGVNTAAYRNMTIISPLYNISEKF